MAKLITYDNKAVEFGKDEISRIPYILDIIDTNNTEIEEIPIVGIYAPTLTLVKDLLEMQTKYGVPFKCDPVKSEKLGIISYNSPALKYDPWDGKAPYLEYFNKLTADECTELFRTADYMCCKDLLIGITYIIAQRHLAHDEGIMKAIDEKFSDFEKKLYRAILSNIP